VPEQDRLKGGVADGRENSAKRLDNERRLAQGFEGVVLGSVGAPGRATHRPSPG
jgi:hypothetical protein